MKKWFCTSIILSLTILSFAQKSSPASALSYLNRIPTLDSSSKNFKTCTIDSNNNGIVSVKNSGAAISSIQNDMQNSMMEGVNSFMTNPNSNASMPSQGQINQMMQNATQMKSMTPDSIRQMSQNNQPSNKPPSANTAALMKEVGTAQNAEGKLSILTNELATKSANLGGEYDQKMRQLGDVKNTCVDYKVKGADIAMPKCDCVKAVYLNYHQQRVSLTDEYTQKANELIQSYLPKLKEQLAIIDKVENDTNYGDAIPVPAVKAQLNGLQRQEVNALIPIVGVTDHWLVKSAKEYADLVNTQNGHVPVPCQ